jgi:hypothetical protein
MMRLFKKFGSLLVLLALGAALYSCVEEPTIEPVKTPYSSIRLGNFTSNLDQMSVSVYDTDGSLITTKTLATDQLTERFDVTSGQRRFEVKDAAGNVVYDKQITVISYEEDIIAFTGYSSTVDTLNSFNVVTVPEGLVFLLEAPPADSAWVNFVNFATDTPEQGAAPVDFALYAVVNDTVNDTVFSGTATYPGKEGAQVPAGTYTYSCSVDSTYNVTKEGVTVSSGMRYYFYISGQPRGFHIVEDEQAPLPVRPK